MSRRGRPASPAFLRALASSRAAKRHPDPGPLEGAAAPDDLDGEMGARVEPSPDDESSLPPRPLGDRGQGRKPERPEGARSHLLRVPVTDVERAELQSLAGEGRPLAPFLRQAPGRAARWQAVAAALAAELKTRRGESCAVLSDYVRACEEM